MAPEYRSPVYDLDQSVQVARRITDRGSGAHVSTHELAAMLDYSGAANGAYLNRVAAARLFGLIDGRADAILATERAERIIHPDYPETEIAARIEAFRAVPLYGSFLDAFRGRELPDEAGLANVLVSRFKVPQKVARSIGTRLLASAEQAGLFRVGGPTRMIEPTLNRQATVPRQGEEPKQSIPTLPDPGARRFPKIIDGVLDLMPAVPPWDESEYVDWLDFLDKACRVYYRIGRAKKPVEEEGPDWVK